MTEVEGQRAEGQSIDNTIPVSYIPSQPLTLTVFSGLPGSGKSTRARNLASWNYATVVARDDLRKFVETFDEAELTHRLVQLSVSHLRNRTSIIVDSQNLHPADYARWSELARLSGARLVWIHLDVPLNVCISRDAGRPVPIGESFIRAVYEANSAQMHRLTQLSGARPWLMT